MSNEYWLYWVRMSVIVYERTADCTRIMHGLLQLFLFFFHLLCSGVPPYGQVGRANELDVFFKKPEELFTFQYSERVEKHAPFRSYTL